MMLSTADAAIEAAKIKARALREVGDLGRDALWEVTLPQSTDGGVWSLSFAGQTTLDIAALAMPNVVQSALDGMFGAGSFAVSGVPRGPFRIALTGALGAQSLPETSYPMSATGAQLQPPASLAAIQLDKGESPVMTAIATMVYDDDKLALIPNTETRRLKLKIALLDTLLGTSQKGVDVQTAQRLERLSQQHSNLRGMRADAVADLEAITGQSSTFDQVTTTVATVIAKRTPNGQPYGVLSRRGVL